MKKLMIAAATVALVGGAFAACIDQPGPTPKNYAAVYQWQFKGKTGVGVLVSERYTTGGGCVDKASGKSGEVIRVPGSLAIQAYTYICDPECQLFASQIVNPTKQEYYETKPFATAIYYDQFINKVLSSHVIGKNANQYELAGQAKFTTSETYSAGHDPDQVYELTFAGFGSYDNKNGIVKAVSGNFAGTQTPPKYAGIVEVNGVRVRCPAADYWNCQTLTYAGAPGAPSVAYGTWSVKYNSAASNKLANNSSYWVK